MVRHQKIKQILNISLLGLLFLAGCSTPKRTGVALYAPETNYRKAIIDTTQFVEQTTGSLEQPVFVEQPEFYDLPKEVDKAMHWINTFAFEDTDISPEDAIIDSVHIAEIEKPIIKEVEIAIVDSVYLEVDSVQHARQEMLLESDSLLEMGIEILPDTLPASLILPIIDEDILVNGVSVYQDTLPMIPLTPARVKPQNDGHYLVTATENKKDYFAGSAKPGRDNSRATSNAEVARLQVKVNELERQNQRLRNALSNVQSGRGNTLYQDRVPSDQIYQDTDRELAEISYRLQVLTDLMIANTAANQVQIRDTVFSGNLIQNTVLQVDTVYDTKLIEDPQLLAEKETLQDSLASMHSYMKLKDKALSSLQGKVIVSQSTDTIFATAYYASGKIISNGEKEILNELEEKIGDKKLHKITILGFTDSSGSPQLNLRLSNQRVVRWVDQLAKIGIKRELIYLQYFGAEYASEEVIQKERRVEIIVEIKK